MMGGKCALFRKPCRWVWRGTARGGELHQCRWVDGDIAGAQTSAAELVSLQMTCSTRTPCSSLVLWSINVHRPPVEKNPLIIVFGVFALHYIHVHPVTHALANTHCRLTLFRHRSITPQRGNCSSRPCHNYLNTTVSPCATCSAHMAGAKRPRPGVSTNASGAAKARHTVPTAKRIHIQHPQKRAKQPNSKLPAAPPPVDVCDDDAAVDDDDLEFVASYGRRLEFLTDMDAATLYAHHLFQFSFFSS